MADASFNATALPVGAHFLWEETGSRKIGTPELFTDEQKALYAAVKDFTYNEVGPLIPRLEAKEPGLMRQLFKRFADELSFFELEIPESVGGMQVDKTTAMLAAEAVSAYGSWSTTVGAHNTIGTLPIVWFGSQYLKDKYLPKLMSGEWMASYCLTEPGSGSDALAAKAWAVKEGDSYILNGTKAWITNGTWADVYIVFAKVDREHFTGFVVERSFPGVSTAAEEHKLGLHGSSTVQLILENVRVPAANVLGEVGKGHRIAFNILNMGRMKLGVGAVGGMKALMGVVASYANTRHQFNRPIASFGAVSKKIAEIATRTYAAESVGYRLGGLLDQSIATIDKNHPNYDAEVIKVFEEFNVECSIAKVFGSDSLALAVDEGVQIHGGNGFSEEYEVARAFRDARITRIYEGTNEINRLLMPGTLLKRMMKGQLDLMTPMQEASEKILSGNLPKQGTGTLSLAKHQISLMRLAYWYAAGTAIQRFMASLMEEQEVLLLISEQMLWIDAADSATARALQFAEKFGANDPRTAVVLAMAQLTTREGYTRTLNTARELLAVSATNDQQAGDYFANLAKLDQPDPTNTIALRKTVSDYFLEKQAWVL
jgi:alkylation response protein AidB-like acyl-CoA dehydrogenase